MAPRALYLDCPRGPVFGFHHPAQGRARATAVLLCPPFGNGELCSYRSRRDWAMQLARAGHATLRIDLPGCGDSSGGPGDRELMAAWTQAVAEGGEWLRAHAGAVRVAAVGIGLGGLLAALAIAEEAPIDDLVLWAVPSRGRTLVRELRAFTRLEDAAPLQADPALGSAPDGSVMNGGFVLSAETVAALEALDLTTLVLPEAERRRVLMLERDGIEVDERLRGFLAARGAAVTVAPGPGYGAMMAEPYLSRSPDAVFATVEDWLAAAEPASEEGPPAGARAATQETAPAGTEPANEEVPPAAAQARPEACAQIELGGTEARVRETPLAVEHPYGRLFGVLAEPDTEERASLCVIFLNAGAIRRVGPNRMWVEAARRFAARGVATLRVDFAGIGDADGDDSAWADDASFHVPEYVEQTRAAIDALVARGLPSRFVLAGLCSGAYWAFHAALADDRVAGALMVNPRVLFWDGRRALVQEAGHAHKLLEGRIWVKLVRGGFSRERVLTFARALLALLARVPARAATRTRAALTGGDRVERALDRLQESGKHLLFVFGPMEQLRLELELDGRLADLQARENVTLELIDGDSEVHTLEPLSLQRRVHELLDRGLEHELSRAPATADYSAAPGPPGRS